MEIMPQISVLMPVYNGENYLYDAIESILNQSYTDFELIILLEYGSNLKTKEIIYGFTDSRIRVIENEEKLGLPASLNKGIQFARGKYIARMDADDMSDPKRFEIQKDYLDCHQDISLCGTAIKINGKKIARKLSSQEGILFSSFFYCPFYHPTVMWRKDDLLKENLMYKVGIAAEDFELWMRVVERLRTANIQKPLLTYRLYGNSRSDMQRDRLKNENEVLIKDFWTRNGLNYDMPKHYVSILNNADRASWEWRIKEVAFKTPYFRKKHAIIEKKMFDLYMAETLSIKTIFESYCRIFLPLYERPICAKIWIWAYCVFRVARRRIRLHLERILKR